MSASTRPDPTAANVSRRHTRQREAIQTVLASGAGFLTAGQVHQRIRRGVTNVSLTTVYRTLQSLTDDGGLDCIRTPEGELAYRWCSTTHHHHLVCRGCGLAIEVHDRRIEEWADALAQEHGFVQLHHDLEVFGLCPSCAES